QAGGNRDRQQDRADRLGHHGPRRRLRGRPSRPPISSGGARGCWVRDVWRWVIAAVSWVERPQRESSVTKMASISRARANAMTFLRSGRSPSAPDAVSLNTATIL